MKLEELSEAGGGWFSPYVPAHTFEAQTDKVHIGMGSEHFNLGYTKANSEGNTLLYE